MHNLSDRHGFSTISRALRVLELGLTRAPELLPHKQSVTALRTHLDEAHRALAEVQEQRIAATAEIRYLDDTLDSHVVTLGQMAHLQFDRDREHPAYRRLFPVAPSTMTAQRASDAQAQYVTVLIQTIQGDDAYAELRDKASDLAHWLEQLSQAVARRQGLYVEEAKARATYEEVAETARRFYNSLYFQFMVTLPEQPALVRSLFPRPTTHSPSHADDPAD